MKRELAIEFSRVTEAAALAGYKWLGRGDKNAADGAAVHAMRIMLNKVDIDGRIVIGEGEIDEAPMLYIGEQVGSGQGDAVDIAVDPEEQRNLPPMVMANEFAPELELPTVHIDNLTAAFEAVHYLHQLGHRQIACVAGPEQMPLSHYRLQGYVQALRRNGITVESSYITRGDFTYEAGAQALTQLMAQPKPPTAVFCHSDVMAIGVLSQAKKMGLRVPQDLSIVGFDDLKLAQYCDPPLTTVAQPRFQIGQQAMLLLLEQLNGQTVASGSRLLDSELIIRGSTAAPKR